jgi:hypothetical protein
MSEVTREEMLRELTTWYKTYPFSDRNAKVYDAIRALIEHEPEVSRGFLEKEARWFFDAPKKMRAHGWLYGLSWKKNGLFHINMHLKEMLRELGHEVKEADDE